MSVAERQRRWLDRRINSGQGDDCAPMRQELSAAQAELAKARARISELEGALRQAQA